MQSWVAVFLMNEKEVFTFNEVVYYLHIYEVNEAGVYGQELQSCMFADCIYA